MDKIQALEFFRDLIADRYRIANRNKAGDKYFEEAYDVLHNMVAEDDKNDWKLSTRLQCKIKAGELSEFKDSYDDNGYEVYLHIKKKESQE